MINIKDSLMIIPITIRLYSNSLVEYPLLPKAKTKFKIMVNKNKKIRRFNSLNREFIPKKRYEDLRSKYYN